MTDKELAKLDPASIFQTPQQVLDDKTLSKEDKIDILKRWSYDERELSVAEEENMMGPNSHLHASLLDEINRCLLELGVDSTKGDHPPTKQG